MRFLTICVRWSHSEVSDTAKLLNVCIGWSYSEVIVHIYWVVIQ